MKRIIEEFSTMIIDPSSWFILVIGMCIFAAVGMLILSYVRSFGKKFQTNTLDDYYPLPRKVLIDNTPALESGFHVKLNYQILIERLTRKLYFLFLLIIVFATTFIFVLYNTSLTENIAPDDTALLQYKKMMSEIIAVEQDLLNLQEKQIDKALKSNSLKLGLSKDSLQTTMVDVLLEQIKSEDKLIVDVSEEFYDIYFLRYVVVRLFVATVMFTLLTYFIRLYFKMREDRYDFVRKEEALSTYFSIVDYIEGYNYRDPSKPFPKRFELLKDKLPPFPLNNLFIQGFSSKSNSKGASDNLYVESIETIRRLSSKQEEVLRNLISEIKKINK